MSLFDQREEQGNQTVPPEQALEELVGEGKKYATVADLAKAYLNADAHITRLEEENANFRKQGDVSTKVEELLQRMNASNAVQQPATPAAEPQRAEPDVATLVQQELQKVLSKNQSESNKQVFERKLIEACGGEDAAYVKLTSAKKNLPGVDIEAIAVANPDTALKLLGLDTTASHTAPDLSRGNPGVQHGAALPGTELYFFKLRESGKISRDEYFRQRNRAISENYELYMSQRAPKK